MNINVNALKEAFYKQLYFDYKSFLKIHIKKDGTDVFSKTLKQYHGFDNDLDLGEIHNNYNSTDLRICASIEEFFNIIKTNSNALEYISFLMQYVKNATTKIEGSWLMVEDTINKLILKHFWEQRFQDGSLAKDGNLTFSIIDKDGKNKTIDLSFNDFCKDPSLVKEHNIIDLMGKLPPKGLNETEEYLYKNYDKKFFIKHLHASRVVRNKFGHKERLLPDNFADAVILARFKLYSYLAATLCLGTNEPKIETQLIIEDHSDSHNAQFKVFEVDNDTILGEISCLKRGPLGSEFILQRCHTYRVEVSTLKMELNLQWFSLSPIGTWDGIKLTLYDNDFEKVAHDPSGTLSSVLDMNEKIAGILAQIDKTLCEGTKEQKRQMDQVLEEFKNLQQDNVKSTQAKFEALLQANKEQNAQLKEINTTLGKQTTMLAEMAASIGDNKSYSHEIATAIKIIAENLAQMRETVTLLLNTIIEKQEQKKRNEKTWFFVKRLPIWIALCAAAIGCVLHFIYTQSLNWVLYKPFYIGALLLGPLALAGWLLIANHTTRRKELITNRVKRNDWGAIGLATLFWGIAIAVTPHQTDEELIQGFSWNNSESVCNTFIEYVEKYLEQHPESEIARVKLGRYYLDIANDQAKAKEITAPMRDVTKYPNGCVTAAEVLYTCGDLIGAKGIIENYGKKYPGKNKTGLARLQALLLIDGTLYDEPNPDLGLSILYDLVDKYNYPQACYDLGHWSSTDLAEWKPGTYEVASLLYDLPTAVKYLRRVATSMPKAALDLGKLYADLSVTDSAKHYLEMAATLAKGELNSEALFNLGLLLERQGQAENEPMDTVVARDYAPAIEHKAILDENHKSAIGLMKRAGQYKGPRTIPPIVFEYLKAKESRGFTDLPDSALKELQDLRPECHFNSTFVKAMEAIIGTERMKQDLNSAILFLRQSAQEGCIYAKMMCAYQDAITAMENGSKSIDIATLRDIEPTIPFAGVLLSDLLIRAGYYGDAVMVSLYPLSKNNPAAAFILSSIPWNYNFGNDTIEFLKDNIYIKELFNSYVLQKIVRLSPYKNRWLFNCLNSDTRKRSLSKDSSLVSVLWSKMSATIERPAIDAYYANYKEGAQLWIDAISAGNNINIKLFTANEFVNEVSLREKLISSALNDLQKNNYKDEDNLWKHLMVCIDKCSPTFKETLLNDRNVKQHYDKFIGTARVGINGKVNIPFKIDISGPSHLLFKPFDLYDQLDEFTQLLKELDQKILETKDEP